MAPNWGGLQTQLGVSPSRLAVRACMCCRSLTSIPSTDPPRFGQAGEEMFVEALVAQAAVEALDKAVLHGLARCDVVPANAAFLLPAQDSVQQGELGTRCR